jgi:hypothetical protein
MKQVALFFPNFGWLSMDYMASCRRRLKSPDITLHPLLSRKVRNNLKSTISRDVTPYSVV